MIALSRDGAKHFCSKFIGGTPGPDMWSLFNTSLGKRKLLKEGDGVYEQYCNSLLRESDRSFFLAVSCFRRALDMVTASSSSWLFVTLYYCSWYSAQSTLGMFGCWVRGRQKKLAIVIQAMHDAPGQQEFAVEKNYVSSVPGSHQLFWDAYYRAMSPAILWTEPSLHLAVAPISSNPTWAIDKRNLLNYRFSQAFRLIDEFTSKFDSHTFPTSLPGDLATQFQIARAMLLFNAEKAVEFGLKTDVFPNHSSRNIAIRELIYRTTPVDLIRYAEETRLSV